VFSVHRSLTHLYEPRAFRFLLLTRAFIGCCIGFSFQHTV